ncbi:MAG: hypothetical protein JJU45_01750 [Acidimicrobiia bacterium]|nr:hypothetical protein [Acidimicrobiia bacterium]
MSVELRPLTGSTPIGLLAALGVLGAAERVVPDRDVTLRWAETIVPFPIVDGFDDIDEVIGVVEEDRKSWSDSLLLHGGPDGQPINDVKPLPVELRRWSALISEAVKGPSRSDRRDADMLCALLAEGASAGKGDAKPSHLHFTAGQQKFLVMVRALADEVGVDEVREALEGPWRFESPLPMLGWDPRGERIYALRGVNPSKEKRRGVPGADWMGFLGMVFFPVARCDTGSHDPLATTACHGSWKHGAFVWPIWNVPLTAAVVRSLLAADVGSEPESRYRRRGVTAIYEAPIRRSDQGGYGTFGPSTVRLPPSGRRRSQR